jgi:hypothetical protein
MPLIKCLNCGRYYQDGEICCVIGPPSRQEPIYEVGESLDALLQKVRKRAAARTGQDLSIRKPDNQYVLLGKDRVIPMAIRYDRGLYFIRIESMFL